MHENSTTSQEGSPGVEQAERQVLGETNYQKAEVVHRFADSHPYVHPLLIGITVLILAGVAFPVIRRFKYSKKADE
jgi:hypothetical protein